MDYMEEFGVYQHVILWSCVFLCYGIYVYTKKRKYNLPPGPIALPLVGNLPFLSDKPYLDFIRWGKKYGGIFRVYLGRSYVTVITDIDLGLQLLGKTTAQDRPPYMFHSIPDGAGFAAINGSEWSEQRRFTMMEMKNLGFGQSHWEKIIQLDISDILELLEKSRGEPVDIEEPLSLGISNSVLSLVTSRRIPKGDQRREILEDGINATQHIHSQTSLITFYPNLFKLAINVGLVSVGDQLKHVLKMNKCVRQEINESKQNRGDHSFIETYLGVIEKYKQQGKETSFNDTTLIGNVQALIIAGSHTTRISLQYLLLAMAAYPNVQAKVHKELDNVLGRDGTVEWTERKSVPYCFATIMEGQRWRTIAPLNLLHRTTEDIQINGYDIPKGTDVLPVIWAFHNDTRYWKNPDNFEPDRFLTDDGKLMDEPKAFIPFSSGKRMCPGKLVALIQVFHYFVSIMQNFKILPASETSLPDLDGSLGLTLIPKQQSLRFVRR